MGTTQLVAIIRNRHIQIVASFVAALVVFNIAFISSNGWARVVWTVLAYAVLYLTIRISRLTVVSLGLSKHAVRAGLRYAAYVIVPICFVLLVLFVTDKSAFHDPRYHQSMPTALFAALVLLPLKTVLFEELAFRGILLALLLRVRPSRQLAAVVSSLLFGLWHIVSATKISDFHPIASVTIPAALIVFGVFLLTTVAGYLFCELRLRSDSLVAPIAVHTFVNGIGIILASLSW